MNLHTAIARQRKSRQQQSGEELPRTTRFTEGHTYAASGRGTKAISFAGTPGRQMTLLVELTARSPLP